MSSRRRSRSKDRVKSSSSKLRMDSKPASTRISDPSLPAGRRREIDNVMKKARASPNSNAYWDKKLLEVEAKDPNRWRHSGYKSLYIDGSSSPSPNGRRSRSRSANRRSPRSPPSRRSPAGRRSPRSPPSRRSPPARGRSLVSRRSPAGSRRAAISSPASRLSRPTARPRSPRSPPHKPCRRSPSASSVSSCSDDSCSVCSPKNNRRARSRSRSYSPPRPRAKNTKVSSPPTKTRVRPRPPSPSPPRRVPRPMTPPTARRATKPDPSDKPTDPRRRPPPPRPRNSTGEVINVSGVKPPLPGSKLAPRKTKEKGPEPVLLKKIKKECTSKKRPGSPGAESSASDDSSTSSTSPIVATTRLTLSERFGKMAQWSVDRERRDIENMRITKTGGDLKVMIEQDEFLYGSPPRRYSLSPVPAGHYPDELLSSGQSRLAAWDDVRVRYQYYKDLGYLRDLSLEDYVKWEEWWYKYQDWLANERHYEHWLSTQSSRRRRKRLPASQRLN